MRIVIAAIGRLKKGPERDLCERYVKLFDNFGRAQALGPLSVVELPEGRDSGALRCDEEAERLSAATAQSDAHILLDETGQALPSREFAALLRAERDRGVRSLAFLIGGADGHGNATREAAQRSLSLSPLTLPHGLARIVLAEQLYRAATIIAGHPYHRE